MRSLMKHVLLLGNQAAGLLPFTDDFTRADGDLGNGWEYSAGVWTISSNEVVAAPTYGSELVTNGGFEAGDPPTSWDARGGATLSSVADPRTGSAGAKAINAARGSDAWVARQTVTVPKNQFVKVSGWLKNVDATNVVLDVIGTTYTGTEWAEKSGVVRLDANPTLDLTVNGSAGVQGRFDDMSVLPVVAKDMLATRDFGTPNVKLSVSVNLLKTAGGLVVALDDWETPANYILAYIGHSDFFWYEILTVEKWVGNVCTRLARLIYIDSDAGNEIGVEYQSGIVRVYYAGRQWGDDYLVNDAGIIGNTRHGMLLTDPQARLIGPFTAEAAAPAIALDGDPEGMFSVTTAAADLWATSGADDWLGRPVLADDGSKWVVIYRSDDDHNSAGGKYHIRFSVDEGANWIAEDTWTDGSTPVTGAPFTSPGGANGNLSDAIVFVAPNGDLLIHAYNSNVGGGDTSVVGTYQYRSENGGATWTNEGRINADETIIGGQDYTVVGSDIYITVMDDPGGDVTKPWTVDVYKSSDSGATWVLAGTVEPTSGNEPGIEWLGGTSFIVVWRDPDTVDADTQTWQSISTDGCATWSAKEAIPGFGAFQRPRMKRFAGGIFLYGRFNFSPHSNTSVATIFYRPDGGSGWGRKTALDGYYTDTAYCDVLERTDGSFYFLNYGGTTAAAKIRSGVFEIA